MGLRDPSRDPFLLPAACLPAACRSDSGWGWPSSIQLPGWAQGLLYYREIILRALLTVALLTVIRSGHFIPMPGVELQQLPLFEARTEGAPRRSARTKQLCVRASALPRCMRLPVAAN